MDGEHGTPAAPHDSNPIPARLPTNPAKLGIVNYCRSLIIDAIIISPKLAANDWQLDHICHGVLSRGDNLTGLGLVVVKLGRDCLNLSETDRSLHSKR